MRRNLSDTDVGILDLRKFYYITDNTDVYVKIPFDVIKAWGYPRDMDNSDAGSIAEFIKSRFNQIIFWDDIGEDKSLYMSTAPQSEDGKVAFDSGIEILPSDFSDGNFELEITEI